MKHSKPDFVNRCRGLRNSSTDGENLLWSVLRNRQVAEAKFRRQHSFDQYILDFYCDEVKLVIEVDGGQHLEQKGYDQERSKCLGQYGIRVLRFWNNDVLLQLDNVVKVIWEEVERRRQGLPTRNKPSP